MSTSDVQKAVTRPALARFARVHNESVRQDIVDGLPRPLGRVLDVGCGAGATGPSLRAAGAEHLTGVEIVPSAARIARERYDTIVEAAVDGALSALDGSPYDTLLGLNVLEHLVDPGSVLAEWRRLGCPGARLQISVPNVRHYSVALNVVVRGTFGYADSDVLDQSHASPVIRAGTSLPWCVTAADTSSESGAPASAASRDSPGLEALSPPSS